MSRAHIDLSTAAGSIGLRVRSFGHVLGRYDYLREIALDYAFFLTHLGIKE